MTITKNDTFTCATDKASTYTFTGKTKKPNAFEDTVKYQFTETSKYHTAKVWRNENWIKDYFTKA